MNDSSASRSYSPSVSTLPPELLDEILSEELLLPSDLARCCLVSRQFLQFSRPALYSSIGCNFFATPGSNKMENSTFKFLQTLRVSSIARHLVNGLAFVSYEKSGWGDDWDETVAEAVEVTSFDDIVVEMLDLSPQVTRLALNLNPLDKALDYVHSHRDRWTELDLPDLAIDVGSSTSAGTFRNLRKLSCFQVTSSGTGNRIVLPPYLEALELDLFQPGLVTIENAWTSLLRSLRLELRSLVNLPDIAKLPHLQHLFLEPPLPVEDPSTIANILNRLGGLVSLSFSFWQSNAFSSASAYVSSLLSQLDLPVHRLDFEEAIPLADLASLIKSDRFKAVRTLGFSKIGLDNWIPKQDLADLSQACEGKGISIECIEQIYTLFDI